MSRNGPTEALRTRRRCAFCEQFEWSVEYLVAGPDQFICDQCVTAAKALLDARAAGSQEPLRVGMDRDRYAWHRLKRHFHPAGLGDIVTTSRVFPARLRADLQTALDALLPASETVTFLGYHTRYTHETCTLTLLLDDTRDPVLIAPPRYEEIDVGDTAPVPCLENGLWLARRDGAPYAVLLAPATEYGRAIGVFLEVGVVAGSAGQATATAVFEAVEQSIRKAGSYRGKVLSLESVDNYSGRSTAIRVHRLEPVGRDDLVLPAGTVALLERNVIGFAAQRQALARYGLSSKKGLLFYGPPGTGKTFTIRYLAGVLEGHTTLLVTAEQIGIIAEYVALARLLQPALLVIEDADLIARERTTMDNICEESLLNRLLNEMDGLAEDVEIIFVLTTNRPEAIEPAIAGRPGRIDQAIEFPLPDHEGRRKLARVYGRAVPLDDQVVEAIAARTSNVSGAFIKELMRRATQFHLESGAQGALAMGAIDQALEEMLFAGGRLNARLLGVDAAAAREGR